MNTYHGYPVPSDCHPRRPWWRYDVESRAFVRTDNEVLTWNRPESMDEAVAAPHLAAYDEHCPLPAPPPLCGQVWVWPSGLAASVVGSGDSSPVAIWGCPVPSGRGRGRTTDNWPPFGGAVLVAGPLSPWADTSEEAP